MDKIIKSSTAVRAIFRTHDLLELESSEAIIDLKNAPKWVSLAVSTCPFVVVRRQQYSNDDIAVGVRGIQRDQRWAGFVAEKSIKSKFSPAELRDKIQNVTAFRLAEIPAFRNLLNLKEEWCNLAFEWGPGGSVGFELATLHHTANKSSDLDIVLFAPEPFSTVYARELLQTSMRISAKIDVLVEAPYCAFSLAEFADCKGRELLLRCADGPRLGINPWHKKSENAWNRTGNDFVARAEAPL